MEKTEEQIEKFRIQLDLTPAMRDLLDDLVRDTGLMTRAEVLRRAISIYAVLVREKAKGARLEIVTLKGPRKEIVCL